MCRTLALFVALLLAGSASTVVADPPGLELTPDRAALMTAVEWQVYGDRISDALVSDNLGVRVTALRMTIQYAPNLGLDRGDVIEMARIYREDGNDNMRRLAVVALNAVDDHWGIDFLARSYRFEDCPAVKQTIGAVLLDHRLRHIGTVEVGHPTVVWPVN